MRIAHVSATFPPYYGGTGNVCFHNSRVLAALGHDVHVYTADWPGDRVDPPGVTVHRFRPTFRIGNAPLLPALSTLSGFDVVHLHCPFILGSELTALTALARRLPLVVTFHNDLVAPGVRGLIFRAYEALVTPAVLKVASRICMVSSGHAQGAQALHRLFRTRPGDLVEVPNGVDIEAFSTTNPGQELRTRVGVDAGQTLVAFVASLDTAHHFKRLDHLLTAISRLHDESVHLLVVGDGDRRPAYESQAMTQGIHQRVHFIGALSHDQIPGALAACDLLVLPSDSVESFGLVLIEAMASGKPVIATNLPGVREIVSEGVDGFVVEPGDIEQMAQRVATLAADPELRRLMGLQGRDKVCRLYSWTTIARRLEQIYLEVSPQAHMPQRVERQPEGT